MQYGRRGAAEKGAAGAAEKGAEMDRRWPGRGGKWRDWRRAKNDFPFEKLLKKYRLGFKSYLGRILDFRATET